MPRTQLPFVALILFLALAGGAFAQPKPLDGASYSSDPYAPPVVLSSVDPADGNYGPEDLKKLNDLAKKYADVATKNYAMIVRVLGAEHNYHCPTFKIVISPKFGGVAGTANDETDVSAAYALAHPDDLGMMVHELTHVVQHYGDQKSGENPGWLTEGIADYVRWFNYEPVRRHPHPHADRAKATGSYQTTAAFLDWAQHKYDPHLVQQLNQLMYDGDYTSGCWQKFTGKTLGELDTEWVASLSR